jgi:hypothetical protein
MSTVATSAARPAVDLPEAAGEHVVLAGPASVKAGAPLAITGRFRISEQRRQALGCEPHRGLALCALAGLSGSARLSLPFLSTALFPDDLHAAGGLVTGWFACDAAVELGIELPGTWHLHAQLGTLSAPVLTVTVL